MFWRLLSAVLLNLAPYERIMLLAGCVQNSKTSTAVESYSKQWLGFTRPGDNEYHAIIFHGRAGGGSHISCHNE